MGMEAGIRAFIAFDLPAELIDFITGISDPLRSYLLKIRWVKRQHLHLTLKFLGNIPKFQIEPVTVQIQEAAKGVDPIRLCASGVGIFPSFRSARVLWLGLEGDTSGLHRIQQDLENRLEEIGFQKESKPFKGHLTLGRFREKERTDSRELERLVKAMEMQKSQEFELNQITFYQSHLAPSGPVYQKLSTVLL
ncbi:MAG: RNA 2',3'-cyclic phosphodiesterase [Thermodesulfobacteriota bacterium]